MKQKSLYPIIGFIILIAGAIALNAKYQKNVDSQVKVTVSPTASVATNSFVSTKVLAVQFEQDIKTAPAGQLIDVRTPAEFAQGHLKEAKNIDFANSATFEASLSALDKQKTYYIYCHSGNRSGQSIAVFKKLGFTNIVELTGGITAWQAAGLELVK